MSNHEDSYRTETRRKRLIAILMAGGTLAALLCVQGMSSHAVVQSTAAAGLVFVLTELSIYCSGVRALSLSSSGISLEQWYGRKVFRVTWLDLRGVAVAADRSTRVWTFFTKAGRSIKWRQAGFRGDRRQDLANALTAALREHRIRIQ